MDKAIKLDGRLSRCAEFVRDGARVADIGTDHAYLPVYLALNGRIKSAIAADINKKPLESGAETINRFGVSDIVKTRLSDGLAEIECSECDDVVIAGMGGELICSIISNAEWLKNSEKRLILQPMTRAEILRKYLYKNGFEILREQAAEGGGRIYTVMLVRYCAKSRELTAAQSYIGRLGFESELDRAYIRGVAASLEKKRDGLAAGGDIESSAAVSEIAVEINRLLQGVKNDEDK